MRAYKVVDVFPTKPLLGNPVAVVLDSDGLETADMQAIARWTNLSETTFLLPPTRPDADYRLRIFAPQGELPFAGHPTLGSAHAALEAGRVDRNGDTLGQECGAGLVEIVVEETDAQRQLTLSLPTSTVTPLAPDQIAEVEEILGQPVVRETPPAVVDVGVAWVVAQLPDADSVMSLKPDFARYAEFERRLGVSGISVFGKHDRGEAAIEVRSFAPSSGVNEDPVCGSGNGSIAAFQSRYGLLPNGETRYVAAQGRCIGRDGRVTVVVEADGRIRLGGTCVTCLDGTLKL